MKKIIIILFTVALIQAIFCALLVTVLRTKEVAISKGTENVITEYENVVAPTVENTIDSSNTIVENTNKNEQEMENSTKVQKEIKEQTEEKKETTTQKQESKKTSNSTTNKSTSTKTTLNNSQKNTSTNKETPKEWSTELHYGGEITDSAGVSGGYWEYGDTIDLTGIDMSDWTIK